MAGDTATHPRGDSHYIGGYRRAADMGRVFAVLGISMGGVFAKLGISVGMVFTKFGISMGMVFTNLGTNG